jgi:hypothetical protein
MRVSRRLEAVVVSSDNQKKREAQGRGAAPYTALLRDYRGGKVQRFGARALARLLADGTKTSVPAVADLGGCKLLTLAMVWLGAGRDFLRLLRWSLGHSFRYRKSILWETSICSPTHPGFPPVHVKTCFFEEMDVRGQGAPFSFFFTNSPDVKIT